MIEPHVVKAGFCFVFMAVATALYIFGIVSPIFTVETANGVYVYLFQMCWQKALGDLDTDSCIKLDKYDCEKQHDLFSSARAFCLISVFVSFATMVFAFLEMGKHKNASKWRLMLSLMTSLSGVVAWSICVSLFSLKQCPLFEQSINNVPGTALGKGSIVLIVAWCLSCLTFLMELVDENRFAVCSSSDSDSPPRRGSRRKDKDKNKERSSSSGKRKSRRH
jgi:hypothetical protein